jgi:hypothetical protein
MGSGSFFRRCRNVRAPFCYRALPRYRATWRFLRAVPPWPVSHDELPGNAQHILQRGNNRHACSAETGDYAGHLQELAEAYLKHDCEIRARC